MLAFLLAATALGVSPESADGDRQVVAKALAFIDGAGAELEKNASCINCHHAPLRRWALREASRIEAPVDGKALQVSSAGQIKKLLDLKDDYRDKQWGHSLAAFYVLGPAEEGGFDVTAAEADDLAKILVAEQTPEGFWKAAQQFGNQRRPKKDANEVQTMWSILALAKLESRDGTQAARERGLKWLQSVEPGTTIDARALRLVVERRWGTPEGADRLQAELLKTQRADGGWGWQADDASDAWATGLALYGLSVSGDKTPAAEIVKAHAFLATTQRENGSWLVEGKLTKNAEMASYFGTVWAVIGLSRTMPK